MTLQELLQQGWAEHDTRTAELADRLEANVALVTDEGGAATFMHLALHAVGDHLGERERATRICEEVVKRLGKDAGTAPHMYLSVARRLSGDDEGAAAAHRAAGDDPALGVRIGMLVAQGLMHAGDWDQAGRLYTAQIATADALDEGHSGERACALVSNNIAGELLGLEKRDAAKDALMEQAAHHARRYWLRVGSWVNDERADYLLAGVHQALGRHEDARRYAERALATIEENGGGEMVDQAFLHLVRAAAARDLADSDTHAAALARAERLAAGFEGEGLLGWFQGELAKAR